MRKFTRQSIERAVTTCVLDAAAQAPNHRLTRPCRSFVVDRAGAMRDRIAQLAEEVALRGMPEPRDAAAQARAHAKREEIARCPLAYSVPGRNDADTHENYAAVACAFEEGLVSGRSNTGGFPGDLALKALLGAEADRELVGTLYFGCPAPGQHVDQRARRRRLHPLGV